LKSEKNIISTSQKQNKGIRPFLIDSIIRVDAKGLSETHRR
jgi:hypothetical protein